MVLRHLGEGLGPTAAWCMSGADDEDFSHDFDLDHILEATLLQHGFRETNTFGVSNADDMGFHGSVSCLNE